MENAPSLDDLERDIPDSTRILIADMILSWARFDSLVSQLLIVTHGMPMDVGALFIGNMPTKTKLDKMVELSSHFQMPGTDGIKAIRRAHGEHADVRNLICHAGCAGYLKNEPERLAFAPVKAMKRKVGHMVMEVIYLDQIRQADAFARECGDKLDHLVGKILARQTIHRQSSL